jgi:hypothetical protein
MLDADVVCAVERRLRVAVEVHRAARAAGHHMHPQPEPNCAYPSRCAGVDPLVQLASTLHYLSARNVTASASACLHLTGGLCPTCGPAEDAYSATYRELRAILGDRP